MDFAFSPRCEELRAELLDFMDAHVYPAEPTYHDQIQASGDPHHHPRVMEELKAENLRLTAIVDFRRRAIPSLKHAVVTPGKSWTPSSLRTGKRSPACYEETYAPLRMCYAQRAAASPPT